MAVSKVTKRELNFLGSLDKGLLATASTSSTSGPLTREMFWDAALDIYNQGRPRCSDCGLIGCECEPVRARR